MTLTLRSMENGELWVAQLKNEFKKKKDFIMVVKLGEDIHLPLEPITM